MTITCPYCDKDFREDNYDAVPDKRYDAECPHCDKSFVYEIEYEIITTSHKAACLNGGEHEWKIQTCYPEFMTQRVCPCGEKEYIYQGQERQAMADEYYQKIKRDL